MSTEKEKNCPPDVGKEHSKIVIDKKIAIFGHLFIKDFTH
jgi:hypothetical protein